MKAAFLSELAIVRTFALSFIGILAFVFVIICWTAESAAGAAAVVCAMTPMLIMFSLMGYDDLCTPRHHREPLCDHLGMRCRRHRLRFGTRHRAQRGASPLS